MTYSIDEEFQSLLRPLTEQERTRLMINIERDGRFLDPLIVWKEQQVLVDGHNRHELYETALSHLSAPSVEELSFADREAVKSWIVDNQNGRRNNDKWLSYHNGAKPKGEKQGRPKKGDNVSPLPPAEKKQAQRDREFREACDTVEEEQGEAALHEMLSDPKVSKAEIKRQADTKPHVTNNSGNNEWYTPARYVDAARLVMGDIDLDPASSTVANRTVQAAEFFSAEQNGLEQDWHGRVWMNPPYASPLIGMFAEKFQQAIESGEVDEAVSLVNNATETVWFELMASVSTAVCFPRGRIKFNDSTGKPKNSPLQGQALLYVGPNNRRFIEVFSELGVCFEST